MKCFNRRSRQASTEAWTDSLPYHCTFHLVSESCNAAYRSSMQNMRSHSDQRVLIAFTAPQMIVALKVKQWRMMAYHWVIFRIKQCIYLAERGHVLRLLASSLLRSTAAADPHFTFSHPLTATLQRKNSSRGPPAKSTFPKELKASTVKVTV